MKYGGSFLRIWSEKPEAVCVRFRFPVRYRRFCRESRCVSWKSPGADPPPFALKLTLRAQTKALGGGCWPGDFRRKPRILPHEIVGIYFRNRICMIDINQPEACMLAAEGASRAPALMNIRILRGSTAQARQRQLWIVPVGWPGWSRERRIAEAAICRAGVK